MITKGKNVILSENDSQFASASKPCVFLSHKSEDTDYVEAIGNCLVDHGINIYFDKNDKRLAQAMGTGNNSEVVKCIEEGVSKSTHILCFVSEKTKQSWWVPYELGYGKKSGKNIATLARNDITSIPEYLKIEKIIISKQELKEYIESLALKIINESAEIRNKLNYSTNLSLETAGKYLK